MNIYRFSAAICALIVLQALWVSSIVARRGAQHEPWSIQDSGGRPRVRSKEGSGGSFMLEFLDAEGKPVMQLGCGEKGLPLLDMNHGGVRFRVGESPTRRGDLDLTLSHARGSAQLHASGLRLVGANENVMAKLETEDDSHADLTMVVSGGRGAKVFASHEAAGLILGLEAPNGGDISDGPDAAMIVDRYSESFWIGPHNMIEDSKFPESGLSVRHMRNAVTSLVMDTGPASLGMQLKTSAEKGAWFHIGGSKKSQTVEMGISPEGDSYVQGSDLERQWLWGLPNRGK